MIARLQAMLFAIVALLAGTDLVWASSVHFDIDAPAYALLAAISAALAGGAFLYTRYRPDPRLAAMLSGTSFLIAMSASFSVLNFFLLTVAGPRIDLPLAAIDRAMGVDWPALMAFIAHYPAVNMIFQLVYISVLPQIALLVVALGLKGEPRRIYELCLAVSIGAAIAMTIWTIAPSFGAFSVYDLPPAVSEKLVLALDGRYAHDLVQLLAHGPGRIAPGAAKGLIGFPSYHAELALLVVWYAREIPVLRWGVLALNAMVLVATPIQGGHHVVDVVAGFAVAAAAIWLTGQARDFAGRESIALALPAQSASP
ncbi:MAG: phosphatase PAP2 family protein [Proteobacteria bacterium]|nr:phosphatase PAP2 family protein [Pseudomonadota bacterium]